MAHRPLSSILIAAALAALGMAGAVVVSFTPVSNWTWGADLLRYYPAWFRFAWLAAGLAGLATVLWLTRRDRNARAAARTITPLAVGAVTALLAGLVFHLARSRTGLLGDGYQIVVDLRQGHPPTIRSAMYNLLEPALVRLLRPGGVPTLTEAGLLSTLVGMLTVGWLAVVVTRRMRAADPASATMRDSSLMVAVVLGTMASMQLFFGYVESYCLLAGSLVWFLVSALDRREGRGSLIPPFLATVLAALSHPFGLLLGPAFLVLAADGPAGGRVRRVVLSGLALASVFGLVAMAAAVWPAGADGRTAVKFLAPFQVWRQSMGVVAEGAGTRNIYGLDSIFTWRQMADVVNHLWLTAAPALCVLAGLAATTAGRRALVAPAARVALAAAIPYLLLRAGMRTLLGPTRDWDLFAVTGIAMTGWAALAGAAWIDAVGTGGRLVGVALVAGLAFLVPWIGMQVDPGRSVARHLAVVDARPALEPSVAATFHSAMGLRFLSLNESELAANAFERAWTINPSWNFAWRAALAYMTIGQPEKAAAALLEVTRERPDDWRGWSELGHAWASMNRYDRAEPALRRAIALEATATAPHIHLARTLGMLGREREARAQLEMARPLLRPGDPLANDFVLLDANLPPTYAPPRAPDAGATPPR